MPDLLDLIDRHFPGRRIGGPAHDPGDPVADARADAAGLREVRARTGRLRPRDLAPLIAARGRAADARYADAYYREAVAIAMREAGRVGAKA